MRREEIEAFIVEAITSEIPWTTTVDGEAKKVVRQVAATIAEKWEEDVTDEREEG